MRSGDSHGYHLVERRRMVSNGKNKVGFVKKRNWHKRDYLKRFCSVEGGIDYHFHKHLHS